MVKLTYADWLKAGEARYGTDRKLWLFRCPACGYHQSWNDFVLAGMPQADIEKYLMFSCLGRFNGHGDVPMGTQPGPCNYTGGGLFRLNPIHIEFDGTIAEIFDFAKDPIVPVKEHASAVTS